MATIWMRVPKASIPLGLIYMIFMLSNRKTMEVQQAFVVNDESKHVVLQTFPDKKDIVSTPVEPLKTTLKPQPLTFDSERIKKDILIVEQQQKLIKKPKPDPVENPDLQNVLDILKIKDIKICKSIYKRTPVGADVIFTNNVDSLYCYTRIQNTGAKKEVKHVWYYEDQIMTQVRYNVKKSNIYRSWTKKTILSTQVGRWRVDVQDPDGTIIGSKKFEIKNISNLN
jgi:hypothetical protein